VEVYYGTFKMSGNAWPERIFLSNNTRFITISGSLSGRPMYIDLGVTGSVPFTSWAAQPVLVLDNSYSSGNLATLKTLFTLGNTGLRESPYTEMAIPGNYVIGNDGKMPPPPPSSGISNITYSYVSGGTWTLDSDGRYKSPVIGDNSITKMRVNFTSTAANANIVVKLDVSSESSFDWAFISTLDNSSATGNSDYYTGSRISGTATVTIAIPVPTPGSHFIDIGYRKNEVDSDGSDCAWFKVF
jgi:hypothetical protein